MTNHIWLAFERRSNGPHQKAQRQRPRANRVLGFAHPPGSSPKEPYLWSSNRKRPGAPLARRNEFAAAPHAVAPRGVIRLHHDQQRAIADDLFEDQRRSIVGCCETPPTRSANASFLSQPGRRSSASCLALGVLISGGPWTAPRPIDSHADNALRSRLFSFHRRTISSDLTTRLALGVLRPLTSPKAPLKSRRIHQPRR